MALVAWESICKPRKQGGFDFKMLHNWNLATITKYIWWICEKKRQSMGEMGPHGLHKTRRMDEL